MEVLLFLSFGVVSSNLLCKYVISKSCPSQISRGLQGECLKTKNLDSKQRLGCQAFLLLSVNLWAQVRSQDFSAKAVYLLQNDNHLEVSNEILSPEESSASLSVLLTLNHLEGCPFQS
jgi:hypothetical protein